MTGVEGRAASDDRNERDPSSARDWRPSATRSEFAPITGEQLAEEVAAKVVQRVGTEPRPSFHESQHCDSDADAGCRLLVIGLRELLVEGLGQLPRAVLLLGI